MERDAVFMTPDANGWREYQMYVMKKLDSIDSRLDRMEANMHALSDDVLTLRVKAGVWGGIVGAVVAFVTAVIVKLAGR